MVCTGLGIALTFKVNKIQNVIEILCLLAYVNALRGLILFDVNNLDTNRTHQF